MLFALNLNFDIHPNHHMTELLLLCSIQTTTSGETYLYAHSQRNTKHKHMHITSTTGKVVRCCICSEIHTMFYTHILPVTHLPDNRHLLFHSRPLSSTKSYQSGYQCLNISDQSQKRQIANKMHDIRDRKFDDDGKKNEIKIKRWTNKNETLLPPSSLKLLCDWLL